MKVPVSSPQINNCPQSPNPNKPVYEPTSVLDLRRSPSPVPRRPPSSTTTTTDPLDHWDEHVLQTLDWDSIMRELDFHDDSTVVPSLRSFPIPPPQYSQNLPDLTAPHNLDPLQLLQPDINDIYNLSNSLDLSHNSSPPIGFDFIQDLIKSVDCFDSNQPQLAHVILERLNQRLQSPTGKPLQRAAFYFKEALLSLLAGSTRSPTTRLSSWSEIVQTIKAYKAFTGISPIPMFTHFTTNQALLESLDATQPFIHVIDFDIGFGSHYASFIKEFAERSEFAHNSNKISSAAVPVLRITAVVAEEFAVETRLIKESLSQFAHEQKIRFQIDFVLFRTFEILSFKLVKFVDGEKTAVLLSPAIFRRLGSATNSAAFVADLRRVSPAVVVFADSEEWVEPGAASFRRNFVNGLEFYSVLFESLDAAAAATAGGGEWVKKIEMFLMRERIAKAVEVCGRRAAAAALPWRDMFYGAGMRPVMSSQFADFQAECLLGKVQMKGFYVAKRHAELVLCWHERPLIAISTWKC